MAGKKNGKKKLEAFADMYGDCQSDSSGCNNLCVYLHAITRTGGKLCIRYDSHLAVFFHSFGTRCGMGGKNEIMEGQYICQGVPYVAGVCSVGRFYELFVYSVDIRLCFSLIR